MCLNANTPQFGHRAPLLEHQLRRNEQASNPLEVQVGHSDPEVEPESSTCIRSIQAAVHRSRIVLSEKMFTRKNWIEPVSIRSGYEILLGHLVDFGIFSLIVDLQKLPS